MNAWGPLSSNGSIHFRHNMSLNVSGGENDCTRIDSRDVLKAKLIVLTYFIFTS